MEEASSKAKEATGQNGSGGGIFSELKDEVSEAALSVLSPVAKKGATKLAEMAIKKGPELLEGTILPKLDEMGGPAGLFDAAKDMIPGGGDDDSDGDKGTADGTGKGRRMPIQQAVDVAAPIDVVYDQFTQFEEFPKFMHRVESVEQKEEATVVFHEKIWAWRRQWEAEIVEQRPDERIVWESVSGPDHVGVVTFHELSERLTRIELTIDFDPSGPIEKIARGARFAKRAARGDLKRFKAYVEMQEEQTGDWRGEIQDGEVVDYEDEDERYEDEEPEAEAAEEPEAEYEEEPEAEEAEEDEEPEAEAEEEPEAEVEEEPEEKPAPKRRSRSTSSKNGSSNGSSKSESAKPKSSSRSRSRGSSSKSKSTSQSKSKSSSSGSSSRSRSRGGSQSGSKRSRSKASSKS